MPPYRLLALDVDGTLLDPAGRLQPIVCQAVTAAQQRGLRVLVCTPGFAVIGQAAVHRAQHALHQFVIDLGHAPMVACGRGLPKEGIHAAGAFVAAGPQGMSCHPSAGRRRRCQGARYSGVYFSGVHFSVPRAERSTAPMKRTPRTPSSMRGWSAAGAAKASAVAPGLPRLDVGRDTPQ